MEVFKKDKIKYLINEKEINEDREINGKKEMILEWKKEQEEKKIKNKKEEIEKLKEEKNKEKIKQEIFNKNLFLAKRALKLEQFEESVRLLLDIIKTNQRDLNFIEKEIFDYALSKGLKKKQEDIIFLKYKIEKEKERYNIDYSNYLKEYKKELFVNFVKKCQGYIDIFEKILQNEAKSDLESKVFYHTLEATILRYIAECCSGKTREKEKELYIYFYKKAKELSKNLPELNFFKNRLSFDLSMFYYKIEKNPEKAKNSASEILKVIDNELKQTSHLEDNNIKLLKKYYQCYTKKIIQWQNIISRNNGDKGE